jgi:hypothetical protein
MKYGQVYEEPRHEDTKKAGIKQSLVPAFFVSSCLGGSLPYVTVICYT